MQRKQHSGRPLVSAAASAAGAGGISGDNREDMVKGQVGDPSEAQKLEGKVSSWLHHSRATAQPDKISRSCLVALCVHCGESLESAVMVRYSIGIYGF